MPSPYTPISKLSREEHMQAYLAHRVRYLPDALDSARRKVRALETEAARYGMTELLTVPPHG